MKTEATVSLEKAIRRATRKNGVFGCFEVTIGFFRKERVDYMTCDTKGIFRCYEIAEDDAREWGKKYSKLYYAIEQEIGHKRLRDIMGKAEIQFSAFCNIGNIF